MIPVFKEKKHYCNNKMNTFFSYHTDSNLICINFSLPGKVLLKAIMAAIIFIFQIDLLKTALM